MSSIHKLTYNYYGFPRFHIFNIHQNIIAGERLMGGCLLALQEHPDTCCTHMTVSVKAGGHFLLLTSPHTKHVWSPSAGIPKSTDPRQLIY